ncbi:Rad9-domain-containing protein [Plectosphaerella plurivora]|uniref:DNA repair protein rad9 n=1 Tax=Plectosphaerella plurivora TaxID=936078 RepID=A0A9P8VJ93_9PEZI|nr:Rad9-domain-containing protein [Plectosphaerella plurivora]
MPIVSLTLNEDAVAALRDALICLNKFSDDVSFEAQKDKLILTALNSSKSAYACFSFATSKFCARYNFEGNAQHRDRYYCTLYIRALISIFRSRAGGDPQRDREKDTSIDRCEVTIEDGEALSTRFIAKLIFRNGMSSTHRMPFEVAVPVHAKFNRDEATNHWTMPSRTLRQLMDHFGPGVELLDISSNGEHVKFTCFTEKTLNNDEVLKKPLHTSIAVEVDEFEDIEIEDNLHIIMNVRDFRAIIQHAGIAGNNLTAQYSTPARPVMLTYPGDAVNCEFLLMTVGERSGNPAQKTKRTKGANASKATPRQQLEAASRRQSAAPSEAPSRREPSQQAGVPEEEAPRGSAMPPPPPPALSARNAIHASAFDLRPSQRAPPPATMRSEGLFVDDDNFQWEPVRDEEDEEDNARLEWDHSAQRDDSGLRLSRPNQVDSGDNSFQTQASSAGLEPTQRLSEVEKFGLFYRAP